MFSIDRLGEAARASARSFILTARARPQLPKVFFCHVPKCAGSSVKSALWNQHYKFSLGGSFGIALEPSKRAAAVQDSDMMTIRESMLAYSLADPENFYGAGHAYCRPRLVEEFDEEWRFLTVLRHPIERWISAYIYSTHKSSDWNKNRLDFFSYLASDNGVSNGNAYLRYFSDYSISSGSDIKYFVEQATDNLARFTVVGFQGELSEFSRRIGENLGLELTFQRRNETPRQDLEAELLGNEDLLARIADVCSGDILVYEAIRRASGYDDLTFPGLSSK